jgi:hypothetical protein|nr:MAG TPA: homing endonuclease [Caudoviricetes sp.]
MDKEAWKDVKGYEGYYQVSNYGRVRSVDRVDMRGQHRKGKVLANSLNSGGYLLVDLHRDRKVKYCLVHRLVAGEFLSNPNGLPEINHKDENITNNKVSNLEWCSHSYNINYGTRNEKAGKAIARVQEKPIYVIAPSGHHYCFGSIKKAAELLGLSRGTVSKCLIGRQKHHHGFAFEYAEQRA